MGGVASHSVHPLDPPLSTVLDYYKFFLGFHTLYIKLKWVCDLGFSKMLYVVVQKEQRKIKIELRHIQNSDTGSFKQKGGGGKL